MNNKVEREFPSANHANDDQVKALFDQVEKVQGCLDVNKVGRIPTCGLKTLMGTFRGQVYKGLASLHTVGTRSHLVASSYAFPLILKSRDFKNIKRPFIALFSLLRGVFDT